MHYQKESYIHVHMYVYVRAQMMHSMSKLSTLTLFSGLQQDIKV